MTTTSSSIPQAAATLGNRVRSVELRGPAGRLEALVNEGSPESEFAAVVCHPHPKGGGTMHNKVVYHAMKALNAPEWGLGVPVLRFNFRGTGLREGIHDGAAESGDVLAACEWLENEYKRPLVVLGFSFGAAMALGACCSNEADRNFDVRALIALGLPLRSEGRNYDYPFLAECPLPKLFISGDRDQYAPGAEIVRLAAAAAEPKKLVLIPGADHFFNGQLELMQSYLSAWLKEHVR